MTGRDQTLASLYEKLSRELATFESNPDMSDDEGDAIMGRVHVLEKAIVKEPADTMSGFMIKLAAFEEDIAEQLNGSGLPELFFADLCRTVRRLHGQGFAPQT
ncbi:MULTISPECIES: hypothetical protein [unclassified Chelatococcus]|uniref:hypothetical protein n=1 Tax=unclassified Chelatococcus TaxID=2638111 RepID=UPI001BCEEE88|nr:MULTISPECIES: hypothetical protein [unclassified Chelatococcus]MBS7741467.1 hypothetical protein [Chelatococcus sp. HY11]MBX3544513.1 hypothetical protein [Chelatococcus sp.]MCO5078963.1 hypothetical protein [Chelatococcus sp.]